MTADPYEGRTKPAYDPRTSCWVCGWDHMLPTPCGPTSGVPVGILTYEALKPQGLIPVSKELLQDAGHAVPSWIAHELYEAMTAAPVYGPRLPESDEVEDRTESDVIDVWLVWDDSDYYGPDLEGVCRTRDEAIAYARERSARQYGPPLREMFIQGTAFDLPATTENQA